MNNDIQRLNDSDLSALIVAAMQEWQSRRGKAQPLPATNKPERQKASSAGAASGETPSASLEDNNERLKALYRALKLDDACIARAATLGGIETSRNRANSWMRATASRRVRAAQVQKRFVFISQAEFDAVLVGLGPMLDELDEQD